MKRLRQIALAVLALGGAGLAAAEIVLYENDNYDGRTFRSANSVSNLNNAGFNDRASSAVVRNGSWSICTDAYFRGRCVTLGPGSYPSLGSMGLNDRVSSVRELGWDGSGGGGAGGGTGGRVVLYDAYNFSGASYTVNGNVDNLDGRFNDRARSMIISYGTWELCNDANYGGGCQTYGPGRYQNLGGLSNRVSSVRMTDSGGAGGGGGWSGGNNGGGSWGGGGNWGTGSRAVLFEGANLSGRQFVIDNQVALNFDGTGFNDRASSLRVEGGYWVFCSDANFQGECRTFGPGDYPTLPYGLNNRISSGRRITADYPYRQNPSWDGYTQQ